MTFSLWMPPHVTFRAELFARLSFQYFDLGLHHNPSAPMTTSRLFQPPSSPWPWQFLGCDGDNFATPWKNGPIALRSWHFCATEIQIWHRHLPKPAFRLVTTLHVFVIWNGRGILSSQEKIWSLCVIRRRRRCRRRCSRRSRTVVIDLLMWCVVVIIEIIAASCA